MPTTIENPPPKSNPSPTPESRHEGAQMSFFEHLQELRQRLLYSVLALVIAFFICFYFAGNIYDFLAEPITRTLHELNATRPATQKLSERLVFTNPTEPFNLYIKLSIVAGLFLASPFILWQLWLFISPGLYRHEKRYVFPFVFLTSSLFVGGGLFAHKLAFPAALKFLLEFGHDFVPLITVTEYFSLATTIILGLGLVFELPVVILILSVFGIVTPKFLLRHIRYAILIIAVVAAAIAPTPDWTTLFMFALPMVGLYVLSIGLCYIVYLKKNWSKKRSGE